MMMTKSKQKLFLRNFFNVPILLWAVLITAAGADAALNLSVNPVDEGNSLRFGRIGNSIVVNKEVRIRITSSDGKQYQVFQRVVEPFVNEQGVSLKTNMIQAYTLVGSNSSGTLYLQNIEPLSLSEQLLYTSSAGGENDSFTVVYTTGGDRFNASGNFFGKIIYTLRSLEGASQDTAFLNAYLESSGELKIDIAGTLKRNAVRLYSENERDKQGQVKISFEENPGGKIAIYQELEAFPHNELFEEISKDSVQWATAGQAKGEIYYKSPKPLERKRILLYSSKESDDSFFVNFLIDSEKIENQKSGLYQGKLKYIVETSGLEKEFTLDLQIRIDPIFKLDVQLPAGGMRFANVLATNPPEFREVNVSVKTNLGKPYMVAQNIASLLTNEKGEEISEDFFSMKGELESGSSGKIALGEFSAVKKGQFPVFFSDNNGTSSRFKVIYRLRPYPEIAAGNYSTSIVYSLGEM